MSVGSLQPRYRRLLSIGALLDESVQLFRQHWLMLAVYSAVVLVPTWLVQLLISLLGLRPDSTTSASGDFSVQQLLGFLALTLIMAVLALLWTIASTIVAAELVHGQQPALGRVYRQALGRVPAVLGGAALYFVGSLALTLGAMALFVVTLFGTVGTLVALGGLVFWWRRPARRRPWLKWLIILTAPFGLASYYLVRWSMFVPAIVLEGAGPRGSIQRSSALVSQQWFRAMAVLAIVSLILVVLVSVPVSIVEVAVAIFDSAEGLGMSNTAAMLVNTTSILCQMLFSCIGTITYLLLFIDLRNRREGTDLLERVSALETSVSR